MKVIVPYFTDKDALIQQLEMDQSLNAPYTKSIDEKEQEGEKGDANNREGSVHFSQNTLEVWLLHHSKNFIYNI